MKPRQRRFRCRGVLSECRLNGFADIPHPQKRQTSRRRELIGTATRNDAGGESEPGNLIETLGELLDAPNFTGQSDFPDCRHLVGERLVAEAGGNGQRHRQITCRLIEPEAADDVEIDVGSG